MIIEKNNENLLDNKLYIFFWYDKRAKTNSGITLKYQVITWN